MTTGATGQLGLALPVQGELSGTWGDTVNNGITQYTNIAIAATLTLTNDGAVTLANTTGDASASNITSSLTGAGTVTAQFAIVKVTGTLTTAKVITAPSYSKTYVVVNAATGGIVTFKASGQTGVSIAVGESAWVYYNGTDYVKIVGTATAGAAGGSNTQVQYNSSGSLAGSSNLTFDGTSLTLGGGTANGVTYLNGSKVLTSGSALTFDGTRATIGGGGIYDNAMWSITTPSQVYSLIVDGGTTSNKSRGGFYHPSLNVFALNADSSASLAFTLNTSEQMRLTSTGLGIGTSSPASKLHVAVVGGGVIARFAHTGETNNPYAYFKTSEAGNLASLGSYSSGGNSALGFLTADIERMRLDSAGNLGLGVTPTNSAGYIKMQINGTTGGVLDLFTNGTRTLTAYSGASSSSFGTITNTPLLFQTNDSERMRLDSAGNLGLGVTPSAWRTTYKALQTNGGSFYGFTSNDRVGVSQNAYVDATSFQWTYTTTAAATNYLQISGEHQWYRAASGTAGNTISFTQAMTLDASGNLGVGTTSPINNSGYGGLSLNGTSGSLISLMTSGTETGRIGSLNEQTTIQSKATTGYITFVQGVTGGTERARITVSGGFSVGTTADPGAGAIYATGNITAYYSDDRLKTRLGNIENALDKVDQLQGFYYEANETAQALGYKVKREVGVSAQSVQAVLPEIVSPAPIDQQYLTVDYERLVPLLIEAVKELRAEVKALKGE